MSNLSLRTLFKIIADTSLNPLGLQLERFFGKDLEIKKAINLSKEMKIDLILDIGANRGQYAEKVIQAGFQQKILSFEPLSDAYEILQRKSRHHKNWDVYEKCALGSEEGVQEINIANNEYSSSFLNVNKKHLYIAPQATSQRKENVKILTLDSISDNIQGENLFLKIDTQGFEDRVLLGASEKILKRTKIIQLELSLLELYDGLLTIEKMIPLLRSLNFEPLFFSPGFTDRATNELQQVDGFFIQKELI